MQQWAAREFAGARVPDKRYLRGLALIAQRLAEHSEESFSRACGHDGRQVARRIFGNPKSEVDGLLAGHYEQTAARCGKHKMVLAVQDTTSFNYSSHKATVGLGPIGKGDRGRGLLCHAVLAVSVEGEPLGLLHVGFWARDEGPRQERKKRSAEEKESHKWVVGLRAVEERLPSEQEVVVIADREGDVFDLFAAPRRSNVHLLVRVAHPRNVELMEGERSVRMSLLEAAAAAPVVGEMTVKVARQEGRPERDARLEVRTARVRVAVPRNGRKEEYWKDQELMVIRVSEVTNGEGVEDPIEWVLVTTIPVSTGEEACFVAGLYAKRWVIERLHKVLKSGCQVERVQIDEAERLKKALAIYYVVAWRLLYLTYMARSMPDAPAEAILTHTEVLILTVVTGGSVSTAREALIAIAKLGGYEQYRNGPPPGPKPLWRGIRRLEAMVASWNLAMAYAALSGCESR